MFNIVIEIMYIYFWNGGRGNIVFLKCVLLEVFLNLNFLCGLFFFEYYNNKSIF